MKKTLFLKTISIVILLLFVENISAQCWSSVVVGGEHTIGIKSDGTLWGWGLNSNGQLGNGTNVSSNIPIQIGTDDDWISVSAGYNFTLALKSNGTIWGWGRNSQGQLGLGNSADVSLPTQVGNDTDWIEVMTGNFSSYAKKNDGTLWSCGNNYHGQLGLGVMGSVWVFTKIGVDTDWNKVYPIGDHNLAIKNNGTLWSWGYNSYGQLGDGTTINRNTLVPITCPNTNLGIDEPTAFYSLKAYPNPVKDSLTIAFEQGISTISIYNLVGQEVIAKVINANETTIDVAALPSGTYLVKVYSGDDSKTIKVLKQ